ncbi:nmrA-like family protein [Seiridium cupressi]
MLIAQLGGLTGPGKRGRGSFRDGETKNDQGAARPPKGPPTQPAAAATPAGMTISDAAFIEATKPEDTESFSVDSDMFTAFSPDSSWSEADGSVFQSAPTTSHGVPGIDSILWDSVHAISSNIGTGYSATTPSNSTSAALEQSLPAPEIVAQVSTNIHMGPPVCGPAQTPGTESKPCNCMQRILLLINELETGVISMDDDDDDDDGDGGRAGENGIPQNRRGIDSALALHKETLHYGESMRQCRQCSSRTETRMLLVLLVNRLVALCGNMISIYLHDPRSPALSHEMDMTITVGVYDVDSHGERSAVLRELVAFQLRALHSFIISMLLGTDSAGAKNKVESLLRRLYT